MSNVPTRTHFVLARPEMLSAFASWLHLHRAALLFSLFGMFTSPAANGRALVIDADVLLEKGTVGIALRLSGHSDFRVFTLSEPDRLVIDLPVSDWLTTPAKLERLLVAEGKALAVRYGRFDASTYRVVLDLPAPVRVDRTERRLAEGGVSTISIEWQEVGTFFPQRIGSLFQPPVPRKRPETVAAHRRPVIVIDPGHGGVDPGALGRKGTLEKDVTLTAARMLAGELRSNGGYDVVLTRETDYFVRLGERVAIARRAKADLFVSLHADSAASGTAQGLSVYSVSDRASDKVAAALARRENKSDLIAGADLQDESGEVLSILIDLAQRETRNRSIRLANRIVQQAAISVPLLQNAHRHAGFAVLKAPDVPSVLVELGFLSHPREERLLQSEEHLQKLVGAIAAAIRSFLQTNDAGTNQ